jgi:hypothetical protein
MVFSKTFPRTVPGSNYPIWEEVFLTKEEENEVEENCQREHYVIMDACLKDARSLAIKNALNTEDNIARIAIALFEKRASHIVFWKESKAKEKFDTKR